MQMLLLHESFIRELDPGKNMVGSRDVRCRLKYLTVGVVKSMMILLLMLMMLMCASLLFAV